MWFQFPDNVNGINVQLHEYKPEFQDNDGHKYFRAPDHFAGFILNVPGFRSVERPEGAPEDKSGEMSETDDTLRRLGIELSNSKLEVEDLRARLATVSMERDNLKIEVNELKAKISELEEETKETETPPKPTVSTSVKR